MSYMYTSHVPSLLISTVSTISVSKSPFADASLNRVVQAYSSRPIVGTMKDEITKRQSEKLDSFFLVSKMVHLFSEKANSFLADYSTVFECYKTCETVFYDRVTDMSPQTTHSQRPLLANVVMRTPLFGQPRLLRIRSQEIRFADQQVRALGRSAKHSYI